MPEPTTIQGKLKFIQNVLNDGFMATNQDEKAAREYIEDVITAVKTSALPDTPLKTSYNARPVGYMTQSLLDFWTKGPLVPEDIKGYIYANEVGDAKIALYTAKQIADSIVAERMYDRLRGVLHRQILVTHPHLTHPEIAAVIDKAME